MAATKTEFTVAYDEQRALTNPWRTSYLDTAQKVQELAGSPIKIFVITSTVEEIRP
jgi:hypothetical protein